MHDAYEISNILNLTVQIEAIAAYDGNIIIGTRQGHLYMYSLSMINGNQKYEIGQYCKTFSKKPIQQIEVIAEANTLLCLTDNVLGTYNLKSNNFPLIKEYKQTKGASLFALENQSTTSVTGESNSVVRLCVAVKRKIQLYCGKNGEFKQHLFDFNTPDVPRVMGWGQQYLCVGFKAEYIMYDLSSGKPHELFPTSSSKSLEPTIAKYNETSFLLGRDQSLVLVEEATKKDTKKTGQVEEVAKIEIKKTIKLDEPPLAIVWDEPYVLVLFQEKLKVQSIEPTMFVQTLDCNKARLMYRCQRGLIFLASMGQVWSVTSVDINKQIDQLIKDKHFEIAINLTNLGNCSDDERDKKIHSIKKLLVHQLFENKKYKKAMNEFLKLDIDPSEVIKLFPELDNRPGYENKNAVLKGKDLEEALDALIEYLVGLRTKLSAKLDAGQDETNQKIVTQQLELIHTTLLKCYLQTNDALISPLLRVNNYRIEEAERTLQQHGKLSELIILYETKGQHMKALQLLREQAKQPDSMLYGFDKTKQYLQQLGAEHINLIFKFSDWILKEYPEEGLKIFTDRDEEVQTLPRAKILDFLLREHETLVIPYLEHVVHAWNDKNPLFHDALVNMYREKITDKNGTATEKELQHIKSKLLKFLEKSQHYTPEKVLLHFPKENLFEERAAILSKLGRHDQALGIYVQILGDVDKAIKYCEDVCQKSNVNNNQDVYVILVRILLNPESSSVLSGPLASVPRHPKTSQPDLETALNILDKHAESISPVRALSVLPDTVPLHRLKHFLEIALDRQLTQKRQTQMLKGLLYAEHIQVQEMKQSHESKCVVISDSKVCPVCKKRFGNQSAFVRYPNGDIVHYSCRIDK